jgi:hypothetical protein
MPMRQLRARLWRATQYSAVVIAIVGPVAYASDLDDLFLTSLSTFGILLMTNVRGAAKAIGIGTSAALLNLMSISNRLLLGEDVNRVIAAAILAAVASWIYVPLFRVLPSRERFMLSCVVGQAYAGISIMHFELVVVESDIVSVIGHFAALGMWLLNVLMIYRAARTGDGSGFGRYVLLVAAGVVLTTTIGNGTGALRLEAGWWIVGTAVSAAAFGAFAALLSYLGEKIYVLSGLAEYLHVLATPIAWFGVGYVVIVVVFASWSWAIDVAACRSVADCVRPFAGSGISPDTSFGGFLYFSVVTIATVGFGDIVPVTPLSRLACALEVVAGVAWVTVVFAAALAYVQPRFNEIHRRHASRPGSNCRRSVAQVAAQRHAEAGTARLTVRR